MHRLEEWNFMVSENTGELGIQFVVLSLCLPRYIKAKLLRSWF